MSVGRIGLVSAAALAVCFFAACAKDAPRPVSRVMVTGTADVRTPPDTAVVVLSVVTQNSRALEAQQQNARKSEAVISAVKAAAGGNPDILTSDYSLQPRRGWSGDLPRIIGYEASNTVTVTTGELNNVGAVLDAATLAGANSVESVSFVLRDAEAARGQTLAEATEQAMAKARAMAAAMGGRVVRVVEQQEGGFEGRPELADERARYYSSAANANMDMSTAKASPRTPVEAGSLDVRSRVQLVVEIEAPAGRD
ncbi:MAG TPA: SIMPL domain-containing protein [Pyrinomonadaceae bacterium]|nr:SIMPL domain-containing protein [Pyrinomonadaceae bacterium]